MKKNLILLSIFVSLLGFTYWWQEKGGEERTEKKRAAIQAISEIDLAFAELRLANLVLKRNSNGQMRVMPGDFSFDEDFYKQFATSLRSLVNVEDIEPLKIKDYKRDDFFPPNPMILEFTMGEGKNVAYIFGRFFDISQKFALEKIVNGKSSLHLIRNDFELEGFFQSEKDFEQQKFSMLLGQLAITSDQMVEKRLGKLFDLSVIRSIEVGPANAQRPFTVNFEKQTTNPVPPRGIRYVGIETKKVVDLINGLAVKEIRSKSNENSTSLGHFVIWKNDSEAIQIVLWRENDGGKDYWIHYPGRDEVLILDGENLKPFHLSVQEFWNRQLSPYKQFDGVFPLPFEIQREGKWSSFQVETGETTDIIKMLKGDPFFEKKDKELKSLISIVLSRDPKVADYLLLKNYKEVLSEAVGKKPWFMLKILGSEFTFLKTEAHIYIYDKGKALAYVFDWKSLSSLWQEWDSVK